MEQTHQKAVAYVLSYKRATEMSLDPDNSLAACADAIASHYKDGFISFGFGQAITLNDRSRGVHAEAIVARHLERFDRSGFGRRIRLATYRIEVYCAGSAMCWLTWEIEPKAAPGWRWTNIYGFRLEPDGDGTWEFCVSDQEIGTLLERRSDFLDLA